MLAKTRTKDLYKSTVEYDTIYLEVDKPTKLYGGNIL